MYFTLFVCVTLVALSSAQDATAKPKAKKSPPSNHTVTDEVEMTFEIKNFDGQGEDYQGTITIGLFGETAPMTVLNFKGICQGFKRGGSREKKLHYKNTYCHRLVKDMLVQCGDVTTGDGTGSRSIYGDRFNDENFIISHESAGIVSMANHGSDTNGSQFFISFTRCRYLDGRHVAFGKIVKGMDVIEQMNDMGPDHSGAAPRHAIKLTECEIKQVEPYQLSRKFMQSDDPNNEL
ncbi:peptidyl-prolyl cis-trans isomerase slr1251-like [Gigantopelta aegis]|uniref:peptidyl-prolyl cis-trans isomerase slr1251-like n=1 Tax=Gigantopelta aegis TaxID=1735272 RepID=UPI001B88AE07|nr:peptidyl-prolyl cis-trans isomerase slr1251-like [Gigantopelta aegis]